MNNNLDLQTKSAEEEQTFGEKLWRHVVDSTAMLTFSNVPFTALDLFWNKMGNEVAQGTRAYVIGSVYGGLGFLIAGGRRFSERKFGITDQTNEGIRSIHDVSVLLGVNLIINPIFYALAGETDPEKIFYGTLSTSALSALIAPVFGAMISVYEDLTEIQKCERKWYPKVLSDLNSKTKKMVVAGLTAASVVTTLGLYELNNYIHRNNSQVQIQECREGNLESLVEN
ncbi:MAG TPA: hypothetical protein VJI68_01595 [Candidatus Nanoarchaeia archaeon]|nr:hypothetical protein [Candidatus Nanoarchaeia archaeon]